MTPKARIWRTLEDVYGVPLSFLGWLLFTASAVALGIVIAGIVYAWLAG